MPHVFLLPGYVGEARERALENIAENCRIAIQSERERRGLDKPAGGTSRQNAGAENLHEGSAPAPPLRLVKDEESEEA